MISIMKKRALHMVYMLMVMFYLIPFQVYAAASETHTPVEGVTVAVSDATNNSMSNGAVTVTAKGSGGVFGIIGASAKTATITLTNSSSEKATIGFDWTATSINELKIDGTQQTATSGSFSKTMDADSSITITITTAKNSTENKLVMSNFTSVSADASFSVTLQYDSNVGNVTVDGTTVESGNAVDVMATGAALKATGNFVAWVDTTTGKILSTDNPYTIMPSADMTVKAVITSNACFKSASDILYEDLNSAISAGISPIILINNGTLPAGDYTIPSGVTLLIPYADNTSAYTDPLTEPERVAEASGYVDPFAYRTLTVPSGVTINCAGNIRVDGRQYSASTQYTGHVYGPYGKIALNGGKINLSGTATLRAYGYITGSGTVTANTGTTVHELFQMADWRGGNNTSSLYEKMKGDSFLVSMFYIQNIESTLVLKQGANLSAHVSIAAGWRGDKTPFNSIAKLVASDGFFYLTGENASVTRTYNGGRVNYKIEGNATIGSISLNLSTGFGSFDMNSAEYVLNLPSNMTIQIAAGTTSLPVDFKLLPGAAIQIDSGARLSMTGTGDNACEMILYDLDDWKSGAYTYNNHFFAVYYSTGTKLSSLPNSPGQLIVNGELSIGDYAGVYSTNAVTAEAGNAALSGTGKITISSSAVTSRTTVKEISGSSTTQVTVAVVPLQATLAGKSTIPTQSMSTGTNYTGLGANHGNRWYVESKTVEASCTENGYTEYTCDGYATKYTANIITATGHADADRNGLCDTCGTNLCAHANTEEIPAVDATCTEKGLTAGTKCTDCGTILTEQTEVPALGHDMQETSAAVAANCTAAGKTAVKTCANGCGTTEGGEEIPATGHSYTSDVTTEPTCTEKGVKTFTCTCGDTYTEDITALGHAEVSHEAKTATCTEIGWDAYVTCSRCDYSTYAEIAALGHTEGAVVVENEKVATCTAEGSYDNVVYCTECDVELSRETKALELAAHTEGAVVVENEVAATCTAEGSYDNVVYCTVCDAELSRETVTVEKLAHTPAAAVEENRKESTCTVAGSYDSVVYCSACNTELSREAKALELAAHTEGAVVVENEVAATCTAEGSYDNVVYCSVCNEELSRETKTLELAAHTPGDAVEENRVESTCTVAGSYESVVYCSICKTEISRTKVDLALAEHTPGTAVEENRNESTCTVAGSYDSVVYCSVCKTHEISRETKALELADHTPGEAVEENRVESTCTVAGSYDSVVYCSVCKTHEISRETKTLELADHTYTYVTNGEIQTGTCKCGATDIQIVHTDDDETVVTVLPEENEDETDTSANVTVGTDLLGDIANKELELHLNSKLLELLFDSNALSSIVTQNSTATNISIVVTDKTSERTDTENKGLLFDISLVVDSGDPTGIDFGDGTVTVTIPLNSLDLTDKQTVKVWYVERDEDGKEIGRTEMTVEDNEFHHDRDKGHVQFKTNHFSEYEVVVVNETGDEVTAPTVTVTAPANDTTINHSIVEAEDGSWTLTLTAADTANTYVYLVKYTLNGVESEKVTNTNSKYSDGNFKIPEGATAVTVKCALLGDANLDGSWGYADYMQGRMANAGLMAFDGLNLLAADVNQDGTWTYADYMLMRMRNAEIISKF